MSGETHSHATCELACGELGAECRLLRWVETHQPRVRADDAAAILLKGRGGKTRPRTGGMGRKGRLLN